MRQSALLGLCWSEVDLDTGWLHLRKQLGRDGKRKDLKTEAAQRSVPLPGSVVHVLRVHKAAQEAERRTAVYWEDHDLVFTTKTGRPVSHRNAHRSWTRIVTKAGVEHRGIHHLRHSFITTLAERGVHERTAQHLAGHEDSRMTRNIYTHIVDRVEVCDENTSDASSPFVRVQDVSGNVRQFGTYNGCNVINVSNFAARQWRVVMRRVGSGEISHGTLWWSVPVGS